MKFSELAQSIMATHNGENKFAPLYVLFGDDEYLIAQAVSYFKSIIAPDFADFNLSIVSANNGISEAIDALYTFPMFDKYKVVIVQDLTEKLSDNDKVLIDKYLAKPSEMSVFVIVCSQEVAKTITKNSYTKYVDCSRLDDASLVVEINKLAMERPSCEIDKDAVKEVITRTLGNMSRIVSEMQKLKAYVQNGIITKNDVCEMVTADLDFQIYEISNAVSEKNASKTLQILDVFFNNGIKPMTVISLLYGHYRKMLHAELHKNDSDATVAELLGVKPAAVYHIRKVSGKYTQLRLKKCVDYLHNLQYDVLSGRRFEKSALHEAVLQLLTI